MPGRVELMNAALRVFSGARVVDPDEDSAEAIHLNGAWDMVRDTVLGDYPFAFATKWTRLATMNEAPPFGYAIAYRLPIDCLYLRDIRQDAKGEIAEYEIVGQEVYTDVAPALARYVYRHTDTAVWPPHFCAVFAIRLAAEVAPYLAGGGRMGLELLRMYHDKLEIAMEQDAKQENPGIKTPESAGYSERF